MSRRLARLNEGTRAQSELTVTEGVTGADFRPLHAQLLSWGGYACRGARTLPAAELTEAAVRRSALGEPLLVPASPGAAAELGMVLPTEPLTPDRVAAQLGSSYEVRTHDVASQVEGPHWALHQWNLYWEARRPLNKDVFTMPAPRLPHPVEDEADSAAVTRKRTADSDVTGQQLKGITPDCKRRLLQVLHLSVAGTTLEAKVQPPAAVRAADLLAQVWPADAPYRPHTSAFLVMSPSGSYTDFRMAGGGSGLWMHVLSGAKVFALVPPSPRNLATYSAWYLAARHSAVFLPPHCEGVVRVEVRAGDTLVIPPGWMHATATTAPTVAVGGNFLLRDSLSIHLEAWRMEEHLGVHPRSRYPLFKQLMWYTAAHYAGALQQLAGLSNEVVRERAAVKLGEWEAEDAEREAAAGAVTAEEAAVGGGRDSDSVMGTSKAGTTTQRRTAQPTSTRDDACNQPPQQGPQPKFSAGNRSIIVQHRPLARFTSAVNSRPAAAVAATAAGALAAAAGPSAREVALVKGEAKLAGTKRRRANSDSFIASDDQGVGRGVASEEQDWHPEGSSSGEEEEEEGDHSDDDGMDFDAVGSGMAGASYNGGVPAASPSSRLRRGQGLPEPRPAAAAAAKALVQEGRGDGRRKVTRFQGSLPPKLAAMLQTISGQEGVQWHGPASSHPQQQQQQQGPQHEHYLPQQPNHDAAPASSAHKPPIRVKLKLRPLEAQPATSGPNGATGAAAGSSHAGASGVPFSSASPRKLIVKISKAGTPKSPNIVGSARAQPLEQAAAQGPAASGAAAQAAARQPSAIAVEEVQQQQQPPIVQPVAIPQVDGAWDGLGNGDEGDNDSTLAVGVPQPQRAGESDSEEVGQGRSGAALADGRHAVAQGGGAPTAGGVCHSEGSPVASQQQQRQRQQQQPQEEEAGEASGREQQSPKRRRLKEQEQQGTKPHRQQSDAMHAEYARMYAELERPPLGLQAAESGGSVGGVSPGRFQQQQQPPRAVVPAASTGAAPATREPPPPPQQHFAASPVAASPPLMQEQQTGVSGLEAEGLAALLAVLRKWAAAHNALNDVPLSIKNPKEVLAALEVGMQGLGLPLIPPPAVDLDAVPLDRLRPLQLPAGPAGTGGTAGGSRRPQQQRSLLTGLQGQVSSDLVEAEVEVAGEGESGGESVGGADDFNVVVEESTGPKARADAALGKLQAKGQAAGRGGKKMSVKKSLMKKLHFK